MLKTLLISCVVSAAILGSSTFVFVNETSPHPSPGMVTFSDPSVIAAQPASAAVSSGRRRADATDIATWLAKVER